MDDAARMRGRSTDAAIDLADELSALVRGKGYAVKADLCESRARFVLVRRWEDGTEWCLGVICESPAGETAEKAFAMLLEEFGSHDSWTAFLSSSLTTLSFPGASSAEELELKLAAVGDWTAVQQAGRRA